MNKFIWTPAAIAAAYILGTLSAGTQTVRIKEPTTKAEMTRFVTGLNKDLDKLTSIVEDEFDAHADLLKAVKKLEKERKLSFNLNYAQLQEQMQNENRQFRSISNIMKTKHDTVKNSISNIR